LVQAVLLKLLQVQHPVAMEEQLHLLALQVAQFLLLVEVVAHQLQ
jgi:hypothetical protein